MLFRSGQHPEVTTVANINRYREQLDKIGFSFDWDREVRTCDPCLLYTSISLAESYGRLFIISCVIGTLNVSMSNIIVSQGASQTSAAAMIIGSIVNVALDPLFR